MSIITNNANDAVIYWRNGFSKDYGETWTISGWDLEQDKKKVKYPRTSASGLNLKSDYSNLIPVRIIFNNRSTICFWKDSTKTIVTCAPGDTFSEEEGVAQCIIRKIFDGNRSAFLRVVEKAYRQPDKNEVKK